MTDDRDRPRPDRPPDYPKRARTNPHGVPIRSASQSDSDDFDETPVDSPVSRRERAASVQAFSLVAKPMLRRLEVLEDKFDRHADRMSDQDVVLARIDERTKAQTETVGGIKDDKKWRTRMILAAIFGSVLSAVVAALATRLA